ncbi:hypothetical protein RFI_09917, partial [Reticulomyxa filosa]
KRTYINISGKSLCGLDAAEEYVFETKEVGRKLEKDNDENILQEEVARVKAFPKSAQSAPHLSGHRQSSSYQLVISDEIGADGTPAMTDTASSSGNNNSNTNQLPLSGTGAGVNRTSPRTLTSGSQPVTLQPKKANSSHDVGATTEMSKKTALTGEDNNTVKSTSSANDSAVTTLSLNPYGSLNRSVHFFPFANTISNSPKTTPRQAAVDASKMRQVSTRSDMTTSHYSRYGEALEEEVEFGWFIFLLQSFFYTYVTNIRIYRAGGVGNNDKAFESFTTSPETTARDRANSREPVENLRYSSAPLLPSEPLKDNLSEKQSPEKRWSLIKGNEEKSAVDTPKEIPVMEHEKSNYLSVVTKHRESWSGTSSKSKPRSVLRSLSIFFFPQNYTTLPSQKAFTDFINRHGPIEEINENMSEDLVLMILDALDACLLSVLKNMRKPFARFQMTAHEKLKADDFYRSINNKNYPLFFNNFAKVSKDKAKMKCN